MTPFRKAKQILDKYTLPSSERTKTKALKDAQKERLKYEPSEAMDGFWDEVYLEIQNYEQ